MTVETFPNPIRWNIPGYRYPQLQRGNTESNCMIEVAKASFRDIHNTSNFIISSTIFSSLFFGLSAWDMHKVNQKFKSTNIKIRLWEVGVTQKLATKKIHDITKIRNELLSKAKTILAPNINKTSKAWMLLGIALNKKYPNKNFPKSEVAKIGRAYKEYARVCYEFDAVQSDFNRMNTNIERWTRIRDKIQNNTLTAEDTQLLSTLKANKLEKWKTKIKNIRLDRIETGLRLGLSIHIAVLIISSIACLILFPVTMPLSAAISLGIGGAIALGGLIGQCFLPKCIKSKQESYKPVEIPLFLPGGCGAPSSSA